MLLMLCRSLLLRRSCSRTLLFRARLLLFQLCTYRLELLIELLLYLLQRLLVQLQLILHGHAAFALCVRLLKPQSHPQQ